MLAALESGRLWDCVSTTDAACKSLGQAIGSLCLSFAQIATACQCFRQVREPYVKSLPVVLAKEDGRIGSRKHYRSSLGIPSCFSMSDRRPGPISFFRSFTTVKRLPR